MSRLIKVTLTAAVTAGTLLLGACAGSEGSNQPTGKEAQDKGPITVVCGAMEDLCQKWTTEFTADTGIKAQFVRLSSGETVARLESAKDSPEFDVWHGGPVDGYGAAAEKSLLEGYASPEAAKIPQKYKDPQHMWTGVYVGVLGFCSNQKVLDQLNVAVPDSWQALLDPKLKGQISTAHPSTSGTAFTTVWTQVSRLNGEEAALDYMAQLHKNVLQYSKSGTAPGQVAGRGEVGVGLVFSHDCVKYKENGMTDLVVSFPKEGTGYEIGGVGLIANSKHRSAAQKYIDWAISAKAQNLGPAVGSYQVLTNTEAISDERMVKLDDVKLVDYDFAKAAKEKPALTARFDEEIAAKPRN